MFGGDVVISTEKIQEPLILMKFNHTVYFNTVIILQILYESKCDCKTLVYSTKSNNDFKIHDLITFGTQYDT